MSLVTFGERSADPTQHEPFSKGKRPTCHEEVETHAHPIGSRYKDPRTGLPPTCASCHEPHSSDHEYMLSFDYRRDLCVQCHAFGTMRAHWITVRSGASRQVF